MGRIVVSDNLSLDGVMQDPAGDEGFARGGWVGAIANRPELAQLALDDALGSDAMLMGRRTYEWFAGRWPSRTGALADHLNGLPKYVVSSTLEHPAWNNSTVLTGDVLDEAARLKAAVRRDILVTASTRIVAHPARARPRRRAAAESLSCRPRRRRAPVRRDERHEVDAAGRQPDHRRRYRLP